MNVPFQIIEKFFDGEAGSQELEELDRWRRSSIENENIFQLLKNERLFAEKKDNTLVIPDKEKVWNRIIRSVSLKKSPRSYSLKTITSVAAAVAVVFLIAGYALSFIDREEAHEQKVTYTTLSAPQGQKSKALLPDGTQVWLNSGASISYSNLFATDNRKISMTGEAYFDVAHDETKPFLLNIDNEVSLTVLGTSFNVNSKKEGIEVALNKGSVHLANRAGDRSLAVLKPMEKAIIEKKNGMLLCHVTTLPEFDDNVWSFQELKFENAPFSRIVSTLEKRFAAKIEYSNINPQKRYWMTIQHETLEETLDVLSKIVPLKYSIDNNNKVVIRGNK